MKKGRDFEMEAFKILKKEFDEVEWLSEKHKSSFDFKCIKGKKVYFGDAKLNHKTLNFSQKEVDFIIYKKDEQVFLVYREDFEKEGVKTKNKNVITISIERDTWKRLMQFKIEHEELKTFEDIIDYLLKNQKQKGK